MRTKANQGRFHHLSGRRGYRALGLFVFVAMVAPAVAQDEIAPFRLTNVSGELSVQYLLDEWEDTRADAASDVSSDIWQEQLTINTRSYIYHPAFLTMRIGGGPLLIQNSYESDGVPGGYDDTLWTFNATLDFLNRRPYAFSMFYVRDYPEVTTGLSGRFNADTEQYGIRGILRDPLLPINVNWEANRRRSSGAGFGTIVDETVDRYALRTQLPYGDGESVGVQLDWSERNSQSGSPGLPIQASKITNFNAVLDSRNYFNHDKAVTLTQRLGFRQQDTVAGFESETEDLFYRGSLIWDKNDATTATGRLNYFDSARDGTWSRSGSVAGGISHRFSDSISLSGSGSLTLDTAPGFSSDVIMARAQANYRRSFAIGNLNSSASLSLAQTDRNADEDTVSVFDEPKVLIGTIPQELNREFVITSSVVVTNEPQTQTFVEGIDYRLFTIGATTSIERIITGNILDGQTVLVSYEVSTGGTVEYRTIGSSVSLNLTLPKWASLYVRLRDRDTRVLSGLATNPLNDVRGYEAGGRIDVPTATGWAFGASYRYIRQDETISPYVGQYLSAYVRTRSVWSTSARFGANRSMVDNEFSAEDTDSVSYSVGITSRLPGGVLVSYDAEYLEDLGGTVLREDWRHSLKVRWRYRLVMLSLSAQTADVRQDGNGRDTTRVSAQISRRFL